MILRWRFDVHGTDLVGPPRQSQTAWIARNMEATGWLTVTAQTIS